MNDSFEAVPLIPKTAVAFVEASVYCTLLPGPLAVVAAVNIWGEGVNLVGCFSTSLVKLPLASDAVKMAGECIVQNMPQKVTTSNLSTMILAAMTDSLISNVGVAPQQPSGIPVAVTAPVGKRIDHGIAPLLCRGQRRAGCSIDRYVIAPVQGI